MPFIRNAQTMNPMEAKHNAEMILEDQESQQRMKGSEIVNQRSPLKAENFKIKYGSKKV